MAVLIDDRERLDVVFVHVVPCAAQRHFRVDACDLAVLHVAQLRLERGDIARRLDAEVLEDELGLRVDMACAAGDIFFSGQLALEVGIADRGADRVRIRVSVSDNKNWAHLHLLLLFVIGARVFTNYSIYFRTSQPSAHDYSPSFRDFARIFYVRAQKTPARKSGQASVCR